MSEKLTLREKLHQKQLIPHHAAIAWWGISVFYC